jgi:aminoglycoside 6'-N-acetyltransferase I
MRIRRWTERDWSEWSRMSQALFPHESRDDLEAGMRAFSTMTDGAVFLSERNDGSVCGFVEVGTRTYADGCASSPVGYIEAWYVDPDVRRAGYGRALLRAAEDWARAQGYTEIASDALLDNVTSHRAHVGSGYEEVERQVVFRKSLVARP